MRSRSVCRFERGRVCAVPPVERGTAPGVDSPSAWLPAATGLRQFIAPRVDVGSAGSAQRLIHRGERRLGRQTHQPVERVAELAGFGSVVSLRLHFRRAFGVSPTAWRQSFGSTRTPLAAAA